jgi:cholinesterase
MNSSAHLLKVQGHAATKHPEVSEYLGIPYVAPPVGNLRWMPPQPFPKSSKTLVADKFSPDCPALYSKPKNSSNPLTNAVQATLSQTGHKQSEDCLTINVWTKPQTGVKSKAVLVGQDVENGVRHVHVGLGLDLRRWFHYRSNE